MVQAGLAAEDNLHSLHSRCASRVWYIVDYLVQPLCTFDQTKVPPLLVQGYQTADSEDQYLMEPSVGSIPKDIEGTFFRNGPGKFKVQTKCV